MYKKIVALVATFGLIIGAIALSAPTLIAQDPNPRTIEYEWYSFFNVSYMQWAWEQMVENTEWEVVSWEYPIVLRSNFLKDGREEWNMGPARLKVTGRNLPEINIDNIGGGLSPAYPDQVAGFLPYNLMEGLEPGVENGTAVVSWYWYYPEREREEAYNLETWGGYFAAECILEGTMVLDRSAAKKVLGITNQQYNNIESWWEENEEAVERAWRWWLYDEAYRTGMQANFYNWALAQWVNDLNLTYSEATDEIAFTYINFNEALDPLLGKWFEETFLPHYSTIRFWDDLWLNMTIGPTTTDVDMDGAMSMQLYQLDDGAWAWECWIGDVPYWAYEFHWYDSPAYPYYGTAFDDHFTPSAFDLLEGETLKFSWGETNLTMRYMEPDPEDFPDKISYDPNSYIEITGPLDMTDWSKTNKRAAWRELGGLLPMGIPYIEWE